MSNYNPDTYIKAFVALGEYLRQPDEQLQNIIQTEKQQNAWFTPENIQSAIDSIANNLTIFNLNEWLAGYDINANRQPKNVGLILAGNIPLVGFHDVLCVILSGNKALIKASTQDSRLIRFLLNKLVEINSTIGGSFAFVERLQDFDAVIATGSDNTSRYFEYYFGKVPHIIRKNRNSIALLTGNETREELHALGHDIFDYYGLGCRNVSKVLVPAGYDFTNFFESIESYSEVNNHHKYHNNYDYNKSIYLVNRDKHYDNGFLLVKQDERLASPLAVLFYEEYDSLEAAQQKIISNTDKIQCVVSEAELQVNNQVVKFGQSQQPGLADYADGIDTMKFLAGL